MEHVRWSSRPRLRTPVVIAAFAGWNDAGEAASNAGHHLADVWATRPFATIDAEDFYDFSCDATARATRRRRSTARSSGRSNELSASSVLGADMDVVLLIGTEPQLKWRTFCSEVIEVVTELNARMLITLGALLAEVPHSRPVSVIGTAADPTLIDQHGLQRSGYEGPTGIVGALHDACNTAGLPSLSLWAAVPAYVQGAPSPKAALALVERVGDVLDLMIPTTALEIASAAYEREVDEVVTNDDELSGYVRRLEDMVDSGEPFGDDDEDEAISADDTVDDLVEELERYLRDQQGD